MMLYPILCIALSLLGAVLSGRIPFPRPQANVQYYNAYQPYAYSYANLQGELACRYVQNYVQTLCTIGNLHVSLLLQLCIYTTMSRV